MDKKVLWNQLQWDGQIITKEAKISNCRHEIAKWRKNNPPYGKEKITDVHKALEEGQTNNTRSQEDILEVSRKLQKACF